MPDEQSPQGPDHLGEDGSATSAARFEEMFEGLRGIVQTLEQGGLGLDEAVDLLERGLELARTCEALIDSAELRVRRLVGEDEPEGLYSSTSESL